MDGGSVWSAQHVDARCRGVVDFHCAVRISSGILVVVVLSFHVWRGRSRGVSEYCSDSVAMVSRQLSRDDQRAALVCGTMGRSIVAAFVWIVADLVQLQ